jgi:uncharacterized membrane protein (UPF0127 family)
MSQKPFLLLLVLAVGCGASGGPKAEVAAASDAAIARPVDDVPARARVRTAGKAQPKLPTKQLEIGIPPREPIKLTVEVASTDEQRQQGLMFREQLGEAEGMIFLFASERYNSFWMRNTLIPLDMYFIDSEWNVVGVVENAVPLTDEPRQVRRMSQYVLEVQAGFARRHGIGEGAKVTLMQKLGEGAP